MSVIFSLTADDFVAYQLFAASQSAGIQSKKRVGRILLSLGFGVASLYYFLAGNTFMAAYCCTVSLLFALFYPWYFILRYKRHYRRAVAENYRGRMEKQSTST